MEQDFNFRKKDTLLDINTLSKTLPSEKITILHIPSLTEIQILEKYEKFRNKRFINEIKKNGMSRKDIQRYVFFVLVEHFLSSDFYLDDLIFLSDIDEIPDFNFIEEMKDLLIYGPLFLKNKNYIWSDSFTLQARHEGSILFDFSQILSNHKILQESYFSRNNFRSRKNSIICGWHLSHFYDIDRTLNKFKLIHPDKDFDRNSLIKCFRNLEYPIENLYGVRENLVENENLLPFDTKTLPKPFLGRKNRKKILLTLVNKFETFENDFDKILFFSIDEKFLPKKNIYKNSEKLFLINEIPNILSKEFLLNQDLVYIILQQGVTLSDLNQDKNFIDENFRFAIFEWKTIKKNILSDLIFPETT